MGQLFGVIDAYVDIFTEEERKEIQQYLKSPKWQFGHVSQKKDIHKKFWIMNLNEYEFFNTYLFNRIQSHVGEKFTLIDVYANGQTYGQSGSWHLDSQNLEDYTFLYYANLNWNASWGGETVFNINNTLQYFIPKPNSGLLFPATIWHYAKSASRDFFDLRTTIAFKLKKQNVQ
jgi:hypothetical protein